MADRRSLKEEEEEESSLSSHEDVNENKEKEEKVINELLSRLQKNFPKEDWDPLYTNLGNLRLFRFARARNLHVEDAWTMLTNDVKWRKEKKVDFIYENFPKTAKGPALIKYWPSNLTKNKVPLDKRGFPIYVERIGFADPRSLMKHVTEEELIDFHIYIMECSERKFVEQIEKNGITNPPKDGVIFIEECSKLGWSQFYTPGFNLLKKLFAIDEAHYPEGLKVLYIINAPTIFTVFQKIISPFLDPFTVQKIQLLGSDYLDILQKDIDIDQIPIELGGKFNPQEEKEGNIWPGGIYGESNFENSGNLKEVVIAARSKYEEKIEVNEERTVIAWEFRTKDYNIGFGVFYQNTETKKLENIIPVQRLESQVIVQNQLITEKKGIYILSWDNTFSLLRSKELSFTLLTEKPLEKEPERKKSKKSKKDKKSKKKRKH